MSKRLMIIGIAVAAVLALSELILPPLISELISKGMARHTGGDAVQVITEKHPAFLMLGGQFDNIKVEGTNVKTDRIVISELKANLTHVQVDMNKLLQERSIVLKSVENVALTAVLTQEELAETLNKSVKGIKNAKVSITPDKVQVASSFSLGGFANVAVTLEGKIISDGEKIKFVTQNFSLNNHALGSIGGSTLTEIPLLEVKKLPFNVEFRDVVMENGRVVIRAARAG